MENLLEEGFALLYPNLAIQINIPWSCSYETNDGRQKCTTSDNPIPAD